MKYLGLILLFIFLSSCSKDIKSVNEYFLQPVKFAKNRITYPTNDFSITLPKNWFWKVEQYESEHIILGIDAGKTDSINGFTRIISVQKFKSSGNNTELEKEYELILAKSKSNKATPQIVESGKTDLLKYDSYFFHSKSENEKSIEIISFLVPAKQTGVFYSITGSCQIEDDLETNMSIIVKCLQSFEYN